MHITFIKFIVYNSTYSIKIPSQTRSTYERVNTQSYGLAYVATMLLSSSYYVMYALYIHFTHIRKQHYII